jgi:predicted MFS family arabinose efflux permease
VGRFGGWLIDQNALGNGYASTFLVSFGLTAAGLAMLVFVREPDSPFVRAKSAVRQRVRELPAMLRGDRGFTLYFVARALGVAGRMAMPFYIVFAKSRFEISGAELGELTAVFALSQSTFQLLWGITADRTGFRATFLLALLTWVAAALLLLQTSAFSGVLVAYAGIAAGLGGFRLSAQNLVLEFGSREDIPMQIAVSNTASEAMGVVGPIAAGLLAASVSYGAVIVVAVAFKLLAVGVILWGVEEPRRRDQADGSPG